MTNRPNAPVSAYAFGDTLGSQPQFGHTRPLSELMPLWQQQIPIVEQQMPWLRSILDSSMVTSIAVPDHDPFDDEVRDWAMREGVYSMDNIQELEDLQPGRVVRMCVPDGLVPDGLADARAVIAEYFVWTVAVDDGMADHGTDLEQVVARTDRVLRGEIGVDDFTPTERVMAGIRDKLVRAGAKDFMPALADAVVADLRSWQDEQDYLRRDTLPTPSDYLSLRTRDFDAGPMMIMHQWLLERDGAEGLPGGRHAGLLNEITDLANLVGGLDNDLTALLKDLARPEPMNIVFVFAMHYDVPLDIACRMALAVHQSLRHRFDRQLDRIRAMAGSNLSLLRQAQAALAWVEGLHAWFISAPRYLPYSIPTHHARSL